MKLMIMTYVSDMARAVAFYESLGLRRVTTGDPDPMWNEFAIGDATLALHGADASTLQPPGTRPQLNLIVPPGEIERLYARCEALGHPIGAPIQDIGFGRFFWVTDPDGLPVQINEARQAAD